MSEKKIHQLTLIFLVFALFVFAALIFLIPVLGILWLLLCILGCLIFSVVKPKIWKMETQRFKKGMRKRVGKLTDAPAQEDQRSVEFVADHELISLNEAGCPRYVIDKEVFLVGRRKGVDEMLPDAMSVGRKHCRIIFRKYSQEYYIEDLRSHNGTYIGTRRLEPFTQEKLLDNSELTLGQYRLRFVRRQR